MEDKYTVPHTPTPGCPLCYGNGKLEVIAHWPLYVPVQAAAALLVKAKDSPNGDDYLVIPGAHAVSEDELPDNFTAACNSLRKFIPWMEEAEADPGNPKAVSYRSGTNYGRSSGQTIPHVHTWYVRTPADVHIPGVATMARDEQVCQERFGLSVSELIALTTSDRDKPSEDEEPVRDEDPWL